MKTSRVLTVVVYVLSMLFGSHIALSDEVKKGPKQTIGDRCLKNGKVTKSTTEEQCRKEQGKWIVASTQATQTPTNAATPTEANKK
jgi:hypothetical protein